MFSVLWSYGNRFLPKTRRERGLHGQISLGFKHGLLSAEILSCCPEQYVFNKEVLQSGLSKLTETRNTSSLSPEHPDLLLVF